MTMIQLTSRRTWLALTMTSVCMAALNVYADVDQGKTETLVVLSATGGKIDKNGQQTITIKMQVAKGWHAYANPVKNEDYETNHTVVKVTSAKNLQKVDINYPAGHSLVIDEMTKERIQAYEG